MTAAKPSSVTARRLWIWPLIVLGSIVALIVATDPMMLWQQALLKILALQRELHQDLATAMRAVAEHDELAAWALAGLAFLYGVFHAAGPGHGKAVITTYLATQKGERWSSLALAVCAALLQGVVAVAIVEILVGILSYSFRTAQGAMTTMEQFSFAMVALLGLLLAIGGLRRVTAYYRQHDHHHCHHHGIGHGRSTWFAALVSIGIRPCSGAILVLVLAHSLGLRLAGIAAVFAMSIGTALTVSIIALLTIYARERVTAYAARHTRESRTLGLAGSVIATAGGILILFLGVSLLMMSAQTGNHPLMGPR